MLLDFQVKNYDYDEDQLQAAATSSHPDDHREPKEFHRAIDNLAHVFRYIYYLANSVHRFVFNFWHPLFFWWKNLSGVIIWSVFKVFCTSEIIKCTTDFHLKFRIKHFYSFLQKVAKKHVFLLPKINYDIWNIQLTDFLFFYHYGLYCIHT